MFRRYARRLMMWGAPIVLGVTAWTVRAAQAPQGDSVGQIRQALLEELRPVSLKNCTLKRFGSRNDGGYLMCENLIQGLGAAYSYGVGPNDEWGCDVSTRYRVPAHEYDCFDPARPVCKTGNLIFHDECIGNRREVVDSRRFDTLANQISKNGDGSKRLIVKIDVEGAEWDSLMASRVPRATVPAGRSEAQTALLCGERALQQLVVRPGDGAVSQPRVPSVVGQQENRRARRRGRHSAGKPAERARQPKRARLPAGFHRSISGSEAGSPCPALLRNDTAFTAIS